MNTLFADTFLVRIAFHRNDDWSRENRDAFERDLDEHLQSAEWQLHGGGWQLEVETPDPGALFNALLREGFEGWRMFPVDDLA